MGPIAQKVRDGAGSLGRFRWQQNSLSAALSSTRSQIHYQQSDLDLSEVDSIHSDKAKFLNKVASYIGNLDDWTDLDKDSIWEDLPGVRNLEQGLVNEKLSEVEDEFVELYEESALSLPTIANFLYGNNSGLSPLLQLVSRDK